ncbi:MAG: acetate--CoA ligase family protein [Deltaproteobacteria bacterium]|nr:acetate--CoA ligase family protein [Deltaproteobacteria bacterium]
MGFSELLYPESIAVIGASRKPGKAGYAVVDNLLKGGFQGEIIPVNREVDEVLGLKCYRDLSSYEGEVDLSVIAVPAGNVIDAVESAIGAGTKALVVISAAFKESGPEGAELERQLAELCLENRVCLLGPKSLGVINTHHKMNASFTKHMPHSGGISVLSESGGVCTAIMDWAAARHLGLAKVVSIGNKADLNEIDLLDQFVKDDQTKVVVGYLEGISSGDEFVKVAESVAVLKPVVIYRAGITQAGVRAACLHTGSRPGANIAYAAAFKRAGVIQAESLEALFDYATALAMQPLPRGDRVAVVTNAGGLGVMASDALELAGMRVAALDERTCTALKEQLPAGASIGNPIDILGDADPDRYAMAVELAQNDTAVNATIVILAPHAMTKPAETIRAIAAHVHSEKPMLVVVLGSADVMPGREELARANLPDYPFPERAVAALKAMHQYATWRARPPRVVTRFPVNRRRVERLVLRQVRTGRQEFGEVRAKEILRAYDFTVPEGYLAKDAVAAIEAAERVGYPVAMKIVSPDIIHKSDVGGVKLHLSDPEQVQDTYDLLSLRIQRRAPEARLEGIYIEKMCPLGLEVVVGMRRDPQFGPMLMFGLGGIFVEELKDEACYLAPITADEAMQMLMGTRSYRLLEGARGQAGVDVSAIAKGMQRMSQLVTDFPQISELEINPFTVGEAGSEPVVVDARMIISGVNQ